MLPGGQAGVDGGASCTVTDNGDGTGTVDCPDGTSLSVALPGSEACTVTDNGDGTGTVSCPDGTSIDVVIVPSPDDGGVSDPDGGDPVPEGGTMLPGNFTIDSPQDLAVLQALLAAGYTGIAGNLDFRPNTFITELTLDGLEVIEGTLILQGQDGSPPISFPDLHTIGVDLSILGGLMPTLEAPVLTTVGRDFTLIVTANLTAATFPSLELVGGNMYINNHVDLATVSFPSLYFANGDVQVFNNAALTSLSFPALRFTGGDMISRVNPLTETIDLSSLESVGNEFDVTEHAALLSLNIDQLAYVGASFTVSVTQNLVTVDGPALVEVEDNFALDENDAMTSFSFDALTRIGGNLALANCDVLPQCLVDAFVAGLPGGQPEGGLFDVGSNDPDGICN